MPGQIIIVGGTSAAGKTTTVATFAKRAQDPYLMFGIDNLLGSMFPGKFSMFGERTREGMYHFHEDRDDPESPFRCGFGDFGWGAIQAFHEMIAAASRAGQNLVVDHLMFLDPPFLQDCIWRLKGLPVLLVALKPPYDVLMQRLATRDVHMPDTMEEVAKSEAQSAALVIANTMQKLTPWFYEASYENDIHDLVIDTTRFGPDEVCEQIEQRLAQGPGSAFERLRARHPQLSVLSG